MPRLQNGSASPRASRIALALSTLFTLVCGGACGTPGAADLLAPAALQAGPTTGTRIWLGPDYWGNRLQDWRFEDGRITCVAKRGWLGLRTAHRLGERVERVGTGLSLSVRVETAGGDESPAPDAIGGLLVGVGRGAMDPRAAAIVHQWSGHGGGLLVGLDGRGVLRCIDNEQPWEAARSGDERLPPRLPRAFRLELAVEPAAAGRARLSAWAVDLERDVVLAAETFDVEAARLVGGVALASHPGTKAQGRTAARFAFRELELSGDGVVRDPTLSFGPIAGTQYTLTRGVLKLTAQLLPVGAEDPQRVALELLRGRRWERVAEADLVVPGWTATFRVEGWDARVEVPYRVVYSMPAPRFEGDPARLDFTYAGIVRRDPRFEGQEPLVLAVLNCNHNNSHALGGGWGLGDAADRTPPNDWVRGMWFPHAEITRAVRAREPDMLFFAGDQIYEGKSPTFADTGQIELDYLYKWYLWVWAYRELTRSLPTVTIPDDHDVYQGNLWGAGGRKAPGADNTGGYVHPASFVRMVERTQTAHLPDPWSRAPLAQGLSSYFTSLEWGGVSFAILEDRKFKSGCAGVLPEGVAAGRPDHVTNPGWDPRVADRPGLDLLGAEQEAFLARWAAEAGSQDAGAPMRAVLSQSPFACLSTHHAAGLVRYEADLDSNGWPQSGRRRALALFSAAHAVHITGDQHLAMVARHGLEAYGDGPWSFTGPAVANFYPRAWAPRQREAYVPAPLADSLGDFEDGFGNKVSVVAVANPGTAERHETPSDLYDRMPGFGAVVFDPAAGTVSFECWPRGVDPAAEGARQYAGWPVTVRP